MRLADDPSTATLNKTYENDFERPFLDLTTKEY